MNFADYVVLAVIVAIVSLAVWYIFRSKKKGRKCIGCPEGGNCSGNCSACAGIKKRQYKDTGTP